MNRACSIFSQVLQLFSRVEFQAAVRQHKAERHARGFSCWGQFVAMLFRHLGRAQPLREICGHQSLQLRSFHHRCHLPPALANRRVQTRAHQPVGESPTEAKRLKLRSMGGAVARKQDGDALRQHTRKGVCATHQVATYSKRRCSLVTR
jgi:Domain of unknown function (DUF4372)